MNWKTLMMNWKKIKVKLVINAPSGSVKRSLESIVIFELVNIYMEIDEDLYFDTLFRSI